MSQIQSRYAMHTIVKSCLLYVIKTNNDLITMTFYTCFYFNLLSRIVHILPTEINRINALTSNWMWTCLYISFFESSIRWSPVRVGIFQICNCVFSRFFHTQNIPNPFSISSCYSLYYKQFCNIQHFIIDLPHSKYSTSEACVRLSVANLFCLVSS